MAEDVKAGVTCVAVIIASIDVFDEGKVDVYLNSTGSRVKSTTEEYNNHQFNVLVNRTRAVQKDDVIKNILLHLDESDNGDEVWLNKIKTINESVIKELSLKQEEVSLFAGEIFSEAEGENYAKHNDTITKGPSVIENSFVISS